jgi:ribosomal 50S subunit-recycling heat shock protein
VQTSSGKRIVRDACTVTAGDRLTLRLHRGSLETTIDRVDEVAEQPK